MIVDWVRVAELQQEIGADGFAEVVTMFLEEADEAIIRIAPGGDARALEADLHFLKGAALNLGFAEFAGLCQDGERRAAMGDGTADLVAVAQSYTQSRQALLAGLSQIRAA